MRRWLIGVSVPRHFVRLAAPRPYVFNKSCYLFNATTESSVFGNLKGCQM